MPGADVRDALADRLHAAAASRRPCEPLSIDHPELTLDDAYAISRTNLRRRLDAGRRLVGFKAGLTADAVRAAVGAAEPDVGALLDDMVEADGAEIAFDRFIQPAVEIELAFVLGAPLPAGPTTADDVLGAVAYVVPAIEIVDSRIVDWKVALVDAVADNASAAGAVLGTQRSAPGSFDPRLVGGVLSINGNVAATGCGAAVLGSPVRSAAWLANGVSRLDSPLEPGHVLLTGSFTSFTPVRPGDVVTAEFDGLGSVSVRLAP